MALSLPASGCQSSKQRDMEGLGSLPTFLADSALISVVLKEHLMFWLFFFWWGGQLASGPSSAGEHFHFSQSSASGTKIAKIITMGKSSSSPPCFKSVAFMPCQPSIRTQAQSLSFHRTVCLVHHKIMHHLHCLRCCSNS